MEFLIIWREGYLCAACNWQALQRGCISYRPMIKFFMHWPWGIAGDMGVTPTPVGKALACYHGEQSLPCHSPAPAPPSSGVSLYVTGTRIRIIETLTFGGQRQIQWGESLLRVFFIGLTKLTEDIIQLSVFRRKVSRGMRWPQNNAVQLERGVRRWKL